MRFTEKIDKTKAPNSPNDYIILGAFTDIARYCQAVDKFGRLEDIEEEFQIDNFDDLRDRLKTYKFLANHEMFCVDVEGYNCMLKDLQEYHDIEKELGIDLKTLFKALREGIYVKNLGVGNTNWGKEIITKVKVPCIKLDYKEHKILCFEQKRNWWYDQFKFEDYGKTWALTKKELL